MTLRLSDKLRKNLEFAITALDGVDDLKEEIKRLKAENRRLLDCSSPKLRERVRELEEALNGIKKDSDSREKYYEGEMKAYNELIDKYDLLQEKYDELLRGQQ